MSFEYIKLYELLSDIERGVIPSGATVAYIIGDQRSHWDKAKDSQQWLLKVMDASGVPWRAWYCYNKFKVKDVNIYWCSQSADRIKTMFCGRILTDAYVEDGTFPSSLGINYLKSRLRSNKDTLGYSLGTALDAYVDTMIPW